METSGTPPVRAGYVQNADGSWSPLTGSGVGTTSSDGALTTSGTPAPIGIMSQNADGTWSGWNGGSGTTAPPQVYPPAGIAVSTGTAWGGSIPPANVALLNAANTFIGDQSINGNLSAGNTNFNSVQAANLVNVGAIDFDTFSLTGIYMVQGATNGPAGATSTDTGTWYVIQGSNEPPSPTRFGFQIAIGVFNWQDVPEFYLRFCHNNVFSPWMIFTGTSTGTAKEAQLG